MKMKRVLFVDDEPALLDGLRSRLHSLRNRWDMVFVESGARAITEIELRAFDVIVTDMRMPGMDGAQLLAIVSERWPQIIRIVLSGYSEEDQTARLLTVAHQYMSKPCETKQIENAISRSLHLHGLLQEPQLRALVGKIRQLPAMPKTYSQLVETMSSGDPSIKAVARLVAADPAIAAKVLQIVNSSFFRLARQITKIEQAITYLGFAAIRNIVLSVEIFSQWRKGSGPAGFDPERLQKQSQRVAAIARSLAAGTSMEDDAMLAGLLHNIGYLVLAQECPRELEQAQQLARERGIPVHEAEREVMGTSQAEIGAYLLGIWGLPYPLIEAIAFQHAPHRIEQTEFDLLAALVIAQALACPDTPNAFGVIETPVQKIDDDYLRPLHAPFDWAEAQRRATDISGEAA
jgi:HD-like signal output (HDOD) protein/CheY-like chemotaxis protein